jgi:hypothetical protein
MMMVATTTTSLAPVRGAEAPKCRSFSCSCLRQREASHSLCLFKASKSLVMRRDSSLCSRGTDKLLAPEAPTGARGTSVLQRFSTLALRNFVSSVLRRFGESEPRCLEQEQEKWWSSQPSWFLLVNLVDRLLTINLRVGICPLKIGTVRKGVGGST